mmetsp:Transcript_10954/g.13426  ORF Transcript_10954/g.13426 Transcript_10954/m.13426 type:complete len:104 (+) Transcript_10954:497-808(+)
MFGMFCGIMLPPPGAIGNETPHRKKNEWVHKSQSHARNDHATPFFFRSSGTCDEFFKRREEHTVLNLTPGIVTLRYVTFVPYDGGTQNAKRKVTAKPFESKSL